MGDKFAMASSKRVSPIPQPPPKRVVGNICVCGDGGKMEPDVKAALVAIYRERLGAGANASRHWIDDLGAKNRYVLEVWTASARTLHGSTPRGHVCRWRQ